jgi:hypothetical protein
MLSKIKCLSKSALALLLFIAFWLFTAVFILNKNLLKKKLASTTWVYSQTFAQTWNFFTQPAIYNDRVIVVLQNSKTQKVDSIDVLALLWQEKRTKFNYARANVWDHIILRTNNAIRERIKNKSFFSVDSNKLNNGEFELIEDKESKRLLNNLKVFAKEQLIHHKVDLQEASYKVCLYTHYISNFSFPRFKINDSLVFVSPLYTFSQ